MNKILHIANTNLEWELTQKSVTPLSLALEKNAIFMQLQFLPFLFAHESDGVCVTAPPGEEFLKGLESLHITPPKLHLLSEESFSAYEKIESWGSSLSVGQWAKTHSLTYPMPSWQIVEQVNSKLFSFSSAPKLPGAKLLYDEKEVWGWIEQAATPVVFKTCFGVSGQGHFIWDKAAAPDPQRLKRFLDREWQEKRPVIGEPWVKRVLDFSTQWKIGAQIHYLGSTLCETSDKGVHKQNIVGEESLILGEIISFLYAHRKLCAQL